MIKVNISGTIALTMSMYDLMRKRKFGKIVRTLLSYRIPYLTSRTSASSDLSQGSTALQT